MHNSKSKNRRITQVNVQTVAMATRTFAAILGSACSVLFLEMFTARATIALSSGFAVLASIFALRIQEGKRSAGGSLKWTKIWKREEEDEEERKRRRRNGRGEDSSRTANSSCSLWRYSSTESRQPPWIRTIRSSTPSTTKNYQTVPLVCFNSSPTSARCSARLRFPSSTTNISSKRSNNNETTEIFLLILLLEEEESYHHHHHHHRQDMQTLESDKNNSSSKRLDRK